MICQKKKWEYKWGGIPPQLKKNIPLWSLDDSSIWNKIAYPSNPPNRGSKTNIWYRVKLPDKLPPQNPHFYVFSFDILPEVYFQGKKIYKFGEINDKGTGGDFAGWPWHMFKVPKDSAGGEYLYFRIYSNYLDIGFFGEILISSKGELIERFLEKDITKLMIGSISIFVSVLFLLSFLSKFKRIEMFILGLLFFNSRFKYNLLCKNTSNIFILSTFKSVYFSWFLFLLSCGNCFVYG